MIIAEPRYVDFTDESGFSVRVEYQETFDEATSKSDINFTAIYVWSPWAGVPYYLNGFVAVDKAEVIAMNSGTPTHQVSIHNANEWTEISGELGSAVGIGHSVTISVNISGFNGMDGFGNGWNVSGSETVELKFAGGIAYIGNEMYQCYIDNGIGWDMVIPHIEDGTSWSMCG